MRYHEMKDLIVTKVRTMVSQYYVQANILRKKKVTIEGKREEKKKQKGK